MQSAWRTLLHVPACRTRIEAYVRRAYEDMKNGCVQCISGGGSLQKNWLHILDTQRASPTSDRAHCKTLNCSTFAIVVVEKYETTFKFKLDPHYDLTIWQFHFI